MQRVTIKTIAITASLLAFGPLSAKSEDPQVLATVGQLEVTSLDLETTLASSPFATQFTAMDEREQAALRGDMLRRLVTSRLLRLEAQRLKLDQSKVFLEELEGQKAGLLYRYYMDKLRDQITIPADTLNAMKQQFKGDVDGLASAKAAYRSEQYRTVRLMTIQSLRDQQKIKLHEDRIIAGVEPDTLLLEGSDITVRYGDVVDTKEYPELPNPEWVKEQLYKRAELLLVAKAASDQGIDVSSKLQRYKEERLPSLLLEQKEAEWIPSQQVLRDWLEQHPDVSKIPERRHIGQLVLASYKDAAAFRKRILNGESLFELAGKYSIDEEGRNNLGDMGWVVEGQGYPELEKEISALEDGKVSPVIQTPMGFHLVTVLERRPGGVRSFLSIQDRVRQLFVQEKLGPYMQGLEQKYKVVWLLHDREMQSAEVKD